MKVIGSRNTGLFRPHGLASAVRLASLSLIPVAALGSVSVVAEEQEESATLQKVVVSAAGYEQKITDAPSSISVVTQEELQEKPYMTLLDAVRDLEGVDIGETRDKTGQGTISMRGMGSDYTLVLVDGKRQSNHGDIYPNNFGGNQFGHVPPMNAIERIEVIRGPASTLYGADAMGGVINIITKKVSDTWSGGLSHSRTIESRDEFGNDITTDISVMGPLIKGKLGLALRGSFYNRNASSPTPESVTDPAGEVHRPSYGFGGGGKTVDSESESFGGTLTWLAADNQSVSLDIDTSTQKYDNTPVIADDGTKEYPVGTVDDYAAMLRIGSTGRIEPRAGYAADQEFTRDSWALTWDGQWDWGNSFVSLAYVETDNLGRTLPYTVAERQEMQDLWNTACGNMGGTVSSGLCKTSGTGFNNNLTEKEKLALMETNLSAAEYEQLLGYMPREKRTLQSNQYTLDAKVDIPYQMAGDHIAVVGAQVIRGELKDGVFGMEDGSPGGVQEHNMWSVFAEDTWYIVQPFALTLGVRYDDHEVFGDQVSPRLYGVYTINSQWTLKGGVSTGYKTPKTTDLYDGIKGFGGQGTSPQYGNPNLKPETSVSSELAVYWQHPKGHNFNATVFENKFKDKIASDACGGAGEQPCAGAGDYGSLGYTSGSTRLTNVDEAVVKGVELAGRWQIVDRLALRANYTYTDSEQKSGTQKGYPLGGTAKNMFNATLDLQATDRFNVYLTMEARDKRFRGFDRNGAVNTGADGEIHYKGYEVFHLGASFKASESVTFNARINNLLDEDFTSYTTRFTSVDDNGTPSDSSDDTYEAAFYDDYNNKDKRRNFWVGVNVTF